MYELGFLNLNWPWPLFVVALIIAIFVAYNYRFWGALALALVLYFGVSWNMWAWVPWVFWLAFFGSLAATAWLVWGRTRMAESAALRLAEIARSAGYLTLAIPVTLLVLSALGAWGRLSAYPKWLTVFLVILLVGLVVWLAAKTIKWLAAAAVALLAIGFLGTALTAGFWSFNEGSRSQQAGTSPTGTPTGTTTSTSPEAPVLPTVPTSTPTGSKPSGTPTGSPTKAKPGTPAKKNPVVVRHTASPTPASPTTSSPSPHPVPTHVSPKPSPTPTHSTSTPPAPPKISPTVSNVTRLSSMFTGGYSPNFCASYSVQSPHGGTLYFIASGGHFSRQSITVKGTGRICGLTYYAPPNAGNYKLTVKVVDNVNHLPDSDVQYVQVSDPPPPPG